MTVILNHQWNMVFAKSIAFGFPRNLLHHHHRIFSALPLAKCCGRAQHDPRSSVPLSPSNRTSYRGSTPDFQICGDFHSVLTGKVTHATTRATVDSIVGPNEQYTGTSYLRYIPPTTSVTMERTRRRASSKRIRRVAAYASRLPIVEMLMAVGVIPSVDGWRMWTNDG